MNSDPWNARFLQSLTPVFPQQESWRKKKRAYAFFSPRRSSSSKMQCQDRSPTWHVNFFLVTDLFDGQGIFSESRFSQYNSYHWSSSFFYIFFCWSTILWLSKSQRESSVKWGGLDWYSFTSQQRRELLHSRSLFRRTVLQLVYDH